MIRIREDFHAADKVGRNYVEVFVNPSRKEIDEALDEYSSFRFLADNDEQRLYIWDANFLHYQVVGHKELLPGYFYLDLIGGKHEDVIIGVAEMKGNVGKVETIDQVETEAYVAERSIQKYNLNHDAKIRKSLENAYVFMSNVGIDQDWSWTEQYYLHLQTHIDYHILPIFRHISTELSDSLLLAPQR